MCLEINRINYKDVKPIKTKVNLLVYKLMKIRKIKEGNKEIVIVKSPFRGAAYEKNKKYKLDCDLQVSMYSSIYEGFHFAFDKKSLLETKKVYPVTLKRRDIRVIPFIVPAGSLLYIGTFDNIEGHGVSNQIIMPSNIEDYDYYELDTSKL